MTSVTAPLVMALAYPAAGACDRGRERGVAGAPGTSRLRGPAYGAASREIAGLFAARPGAAATATAIAEAYAGLGDEVTVAVRSSATTEDLPGMSSAGQHDTYLNIRGEAGVLEAVRLCWASLWTPRAIGYRARRGIAAGEAGMAVVVQRLVPADAAGVLFTVDPAGAGRDRVVVNANWGRRRRSPVPRRHRGPRARHPRRRRLRQRNDTTALR